MPGEPSPVLQLIVVFPYFVPGGTGLGDASIKAPLLRGSLSETGEQSGVAFCLTVTDASSLSRATPPNKRKSYVASAPIQGASADPTEPDAKCRCVCLPNGSGKAQTWCPLSGGGSSYTLLITMHTR